MCGIAGFLSKSQINDNEALLKNMGAEIKSRGPDDFGTWCDKETGIYFSHRRLSILDLSPLGHQPMASQSGKYQMIFNGEIYNHLEIRINLESEFGAIEWRGHSDTETILKSFELSGIKQTVISLVGMFAIAVWDIEMEVLSLCRDRIGEKPLYYGWHNDTFLFGSELKALKVHPSFKAGIDRKALSLFFKYSYIPAPYSIYTGIKKLIPGSILTVSLNDSQEKIEAYWTFKDVVEKKRIGNEAATETELVSRLDELLKISISSQMLSDVPLGAFLSGGIDSTTIVAIMQSVSSRPIKTFTIGFDDKKYNEAEHASQIAKFLGTEHTELYVKPQDILNVIPLLPAMYDEPFSDSSQIPTYLVAKLAKETVTVALTGDAGDELFAGYNRYLFASNIWSKIDKIPFWLRNIMVGVIQSLPPSKWDTVFFALKFLLPSRYRIKNFGDKLHKASSILLSSDQNKLYNKLISHWSEFDNLVINATSSEDYDINQFESLSSIEGMMALDTLTYLPDDILVKVDRAAMANSLETRVPFLDHRIIDFAWSVPMKYKIRDGKGKWLLRQVLNKYVPKELIERPKMGFGVPIDSWLRGPLKEWAEDLLDDKRIREDGLLNPEVIKVKWNEHISGIRNWQYHLWDVLMFQAWYRNQL